MSQSHVLLSITFLLTVYVCKYFVCMKKNLLLKTEVFQPNFDYDPPFFSFVSPRITVEAVCVALFCDCAGY